MWVSRRLIEFLLFITIAIMARRVCGMKPTFLVVHVQTENKGYRER